MHGNKPFMMSQRAPILPPASWLFQSARVLAPTSQGTSFWSLCQTRWKSFSAASCKHRANNVAFGWIVKLPKMWNCLAPVSSVRVVFGQIKANNCNSLYKSVTLNVNILRREKLQTDVSLLRFKHFAAQVRNAWECGCITPLMFMAQTFRSKKKTKQHFAGSARSWSCVILSGANCGWSDGICWRL